MNSDMIIRAVILTKSFMHGGFCVAGIDLNHKKWVRFVADTSGSPLMNQNLMCDDRSICEPLDVVDAEVIQYSPVKHHTENVVVSSALFHKLGRTSIESVTKKLYPSDNHNYIFGNTLSYITQEEMTAKNINYSLMLVLVSNLNITYEIQNTGKIRAAADFCYNNRGYRFIRITDPYIVFADRNYIMQNQTVSIPKAYIVMSLAREPYELNGKYYKFAAKIFA